MACSLAAFRNMSWRERILLGGRDQLWRVRGKDSLLHLAFKIRLPALPAIILCKLLQEWRVKKDLEVRIYCLVLNQAQLAASGLVEPLK